MGVDGWILETKWLLAFLVRALRGAPVARLRVGLLPMLL